MDFVYEESLPTVLNFMALHMSLRSNESDNMTGKDPSKEIGHEEPYYNTKISIFSFTWAGLAAFHKASTI